MNSAKAARNYAVHAKYHPWSRLKKMTSCESRHADLLATVSFMEVWGTQGFHPGNTLFSLRVFLKAKSASKEHKFNHFLKMDVKHIPQKWKVKCWDCMATLRRGKTISVPLPEMHNYPSSSKQAALWSRQLVHMTARVCCLEDHWVVFSPFFPEISLPLYSARYRWSIWSPRDFVLRGASAPPSPGIQRDYIVIMSISILCDSPFHVRDLQSCFINSAWMKPHFKHRGA